MIEQSITIGNIIEIVTIAAGGIMVFSTMRATVSNINDKVDAMQTEIKKLGEILVAQADIRGDIKGLERRVSATEQDIRDLRVGRGFIQGERGIDREYGT